ncbi:MAG TPA: hypothetical protein VJH03_24430 [Blastocatellia bacterium]|nr:hypothetical protein [Blastocatellia bacterium]
MPETSNLCARLNLLIRPALLLLVLIDLVLGPLATFWPRLFMKLIQPGAGPDEPVYLLQRAGTIWLGYLVVQIIAVFVYKRLPEWVFMVAFLRLVEVAADSLYVSKGASIGIGWFGTLGLIAAPAFNFVVGITFVFWYYRCGKQST